MSSIRHYSDSEEEEEEEVEDQNWDDWEAEEDDATEEQGLNPQLLCLFCDSFYNSCSSLFKHCASAHSFDFHEIKKANKLDFYKCFKLINYIRTQVDSLTNPMNKWNNGTCVFSRCICMCCTVAADKCWDWGKICCSDKELKNHLLEADNFEESIIPWDDDRYLNPFLQDDALLYRFDEDGDFEDEDDAMSFDSKELAMHLSQFERLKIDEEDISSKYTSEHKSSCENGEKEVKFSFDKGTNTANPSESLVNGVSDIADGPSAIETTGNRKGTVSCLKIAADEIKNRNKNYFGAYSSFGIHRDMISDKVRTDAYRQALLENPSLLKSAVVMDVGCGTGILSLFAAQAGASRVFAVEASEKMAAVATQIAKDNNLLRNGSSGEGSQHNGVIEVVQGMIEELENADRIQPHSVDVLVSEWMGYCLLYESMLSSVLFARDRWLKPGGAVLPDTATMFVAGFGRGGASISFWENVYGFNMSCIGREVDDNAAGIPIVDVIDSCNIVTTTEVLQVKTCLLITSFQYVELINNYLRPRTMTRLLKLKLFRWIYQGELVCNTTKFETFHLNHLSFKIQLVPMPSTSFDLATMQPKQMEFTADLELEPKFDAPLHHPSGSKSTTNWCHGLVLWFETGFTERFCKEKPVNLSTSPYGPSTHWSQTILTFREPIAIASNVNSEKLALVGTNDCPAVRIQLRVSIVRALQHRSIDISLELTGIGHDGRKQRIKHNYCHKLTLNLIKENGVSEI
ncbi:hypothetical protein ACJIZ3_018621 [Penstemon smallii]|uniref:Protein arginine N-methyltransferase 3 n=1 Tax=Penstemon smallii TaxID=265156 RepID=A0ABD3SYX4_9LAMI